jgi:Phage integrase, N-terminal SAM-like domain
MAIVQRGESVYLVRVYLGRDPITRKRIEINEMVYGDREDAERREQILKNKAKKGSITRTSRMTVKQLVEFYLDTTKRRRSEASQRNLRRFLELYVLPYIGSHQITKIKTSDIQRLFDFLLDPKKEGINEQNKRGSTLRSRSRSEYS